LGHAPRDPDPLSRAVRGYSRRRRPIADWNDDRVYGEILRLLNARQMRGDVPLNLTATSLVTHAYIHTGDERYRRWVLDYLEAWARAYQHKRGACAPTTWVPTALIGELMDGKWWGGYYGCAGRTA
jgi:hypothetical protein